MNKPWTMSDAEREDAVRVRRAVYGERARVLRTISRALRWAREKTSYETYVGDRAYARRLAIGNTWAGTGGLGLMDVERTNIGP